VLAYGLIGMMFYCTVHALGEMALVEEGLEDCLLEGGKEMGWKGRETVEMGLVE
jgi:hypothetical protein